MAKDRTYALGIDFGGTKLLGAVVDLQSGKVIAEAKKRSSASDSPKAVLDRLNAVAEAALDAAKIKPKQIWALVSARPGRWTPKPASCWARQISARRSSTSPLLIR